MLRDRFNRTVRRQVLCGGQNSPAESGSRCKILVQIRGAPILGDADCLTEADPRMTTGAGREGKLTGEPLSYERYVELDQQRRSKLHGLVQRAQSSPGMQSISRRTSRPSVSGASSVSRA